LNNGKMGWGRERRGEIGEMEKNPAVAKACANQRNKKEETPG